MTKDQLSYKTFTARIDTPTLLDSFVPATLTDVAIRFEPIHAAQLKCCEILRDGAAQLTPLDDFQDLAHKLADAAGALDYLFGDFAKRLEYFTLVFFGAVSAGKTSMICDLANTTPGQLSDIIASQPGFDPRRDRVEIGPNVATVNLYEILIERSRIRLVDVPGIGGVAHPSDTLAPFVGMADCIVFLLNAGSDITKDDDDFLYKHVAALHANRGEHDATITERGMDKRVLVVINKWGTAFRFHPPKHAEKEFENKREWILHGRKDLPFKGIAEYFQKLPDVVRADSAVRDLETGEPIRADDAMKPDLSQVITTLEAILSEDGVDLRLNRPRIALLRSIRQARNQLTNEQTKESLTRLHKQFELLGQKSQLVATKIQCDIDDRLTRLEQTMAFFLSSRLKQVIFTWKPTVGFLDGLRGIVPDSLKLGEYGLGKTQMQAELRDKWGAELRQLIERQIPATELSNIVSQETKGIQRVVAATFQLNLADNQDILKKIPALSQRDDGTPGRVDVFAVLKAELDDTVSRVQAGLLDDVLALLSLDTILAIVMGVILTPVASAALIAFRRWRRGEKKGQEAQQELSQTIDKTAHEVAAKVREQVAERIGRGVTELSEKIGSLIGEHQALATSPQRIIGDVAAQLGALQTEVEAMAGPRAEPGRSASERSA